MPESLPTIGESGTTWAAKLNSFISLEHNTDGTHKKNTGVGLHIYTGSAVFPDGQVTSAATFQDLDLSGIVGANTALVLCEILTGGATGTNQFVFAPKGATGAYAYWALPAAESSFNTLYLTGVASRGLVACLTNSSGVVQWGATTKNAANTATIYLRAYIL